MKILFCLFVCCSLFAERTLEEIFTKIYEMGSWNEAGFSHSGSQIEIMQEYVQFLQNFLHENQIRSVVDVGCGDWAFSRYIDWTGIEYLGIDVVPFVIERNQDLFASSLIQFLHADALSMELPEADLLLCKDIFQHLSYATIFQLLKQKDKFKHCLFTDSISSKTLCNGDIPDGHSRPLNLIGPPFELEAKEVFLFPGLSLKQTIHIEN